MVKLSVFISQDMKRRLESLGRRRHRSTSDLVQESLRQYIAVEQLKTIRRISVPLAEAQGFLADEDIFRAVS